MIHIGQRVSEVSLKAPKEFDRRPHEVSVTLSQGSFIVLVVVGLSDYLFVCVIVCLSVVCILYIMYFCTISKAPTAIEIPH